MDNVPVAHIPTAQQVLNTEQQRLAGALGRVMAVLIGVGRGAAIGWGGEEHPAPDSKEDGSVGSGHQPSTEGDETGCSSRLS